MSLVEAGRPLPEDTPAPPTQDASQDATAAATAAAEALPPRPAAGHEASAAVAAAIPEPAAVEKHYQPTVADIDVSDLAEAAAAAGSPEAVIARSRTLTIADAAVISNDVVGGKAVLHVVDRVLISPVLGRELGLPATPGYTVLEAPPPSAGTSGSRQAGLGPASFALSAAVAALLMLRW